MGLHLSAAGHSSRRDAGKGSSSGLKNTNPQAGRKSLRIKKDGSVQAPFSVCLSIGSSSSVMLRLVGHGIVSEKN